MGTILRCEAELPASHLATEIAISLSQGVEAVQSHRLMILRLRDALEAVLGFELVPDDLAGQEQMREARDTLRKSQEYYFQ